MQQRNPWGRPFYGQEPAPAKTNVVPAADAGAVLLKASNEFFAENPVEPEAVPVKKKAGRPKKKADDE